MSHTPGPWKAVQAGSRVRSGPGGDLYECEDDCIVDQNNVEVLGCSEWLRCKPGDMELIAAAPDLLAACKEALTCMEYECSPRSTRELLASAIAKAEGKA